MAVQHPAMVCNLTVISTAAERDGWYPEVLRGMEAVNASQAEVVLQRLSGSGMPQSRRT
jgi:hypothetical protein